MLDPRRWSRRTAVRSVVRSFVLAVVGLALALILLPSGSLPAFAQTGSWLSMFTGAPRARSSTTRPPGTSWSTRADRESWTQLEPMAAHHGADCSGPPNTHQISGYNQAVFNCADHIMTSIYSSGYGLIYLTPDQLVDFSGGETVVRFDMSTFRSSMRDWVDIWLSPWDDQIPAPLESWLPDLTGAPRRAIQIRMDISDDKTYFRGTVIRGFGNSTNVTTNNSLTYESFLTTSASRRDTFELRISRTTLKFGMPTYNKWWVDARSRTSAGTRPSSSLATTRTTRVRIARRRCGPNTWHWDNVSISDATPFVMLKPDLPWVDSTTRRSVNYSGAAPANSHLRFLGIGSNLQVSFNGGQSWQNATMHAVEQSAEEHFKPYWTPVPAGTTRIDFRGSSWFGGGWMVRNPAIWSQTTPPQPLELLHPPSDHRPDPCAGRRPARSDRPGGRPSTAPSNTLRQVQIVRTTNAQVQILGQTFGAGGGRHPDCRQPEPHLHGAPGARRRRDRAIQRDG